MSMLTPIALAALVVTFGTPTAAQTVRTLVVDVDGVPTAGGFVLLVDPRGNEVARTLNGEDGLVALRASRAGEYRLVSERIGYVSTQSEPFSLGAAETLDRTLSLANQPVNLAVVPETAPRCTVGPGAVSAERILWAEVRKGLAAAMFTASPRRYEYLSAVIERDVGPDGRSVFSQQMRVAQGEPLYETLATAGQTAPDEFIVSHDDGSVSYQAPDASVLLAPDFLANHCVSAQRDPSSETALLRFEAADPDQPPFAGTFHVDLTTARLERFEYRFTELPHGLTDERVGGEVTFMQGPSGKLLARDWELRTPVVALDGDGRDTIVTAYRVVGGSLASVQDQNGATVYAADVAELHGSVVDSLERPLAGARVSVLGTDYEAASDGEGRFRIAGLLDGQYAVTFAHSSLDSLLAPPPQIVEFQRGQTDSIRLQLMGADDYVNALVGTGDSATQLPPIEVTGSAESGSRNTISRAALESHADVSVYDAVLRLRPGWLRGRGVANLSGQAFSTGVFRNGRFIGGLNMLTRIDVEFVEEIHYYSRRDAQTRWGFGNDVIEIVDRK